MGSAGFSGDGGAATSALLNYPEDVAVDADVVMFLYRKDDDIRESVSLKIAKHRNGALGEIDLYFKGDRIRFYGMEMKR